MKIRVFVVDDHELVRRALSQMCEERENLELAGQAATARDALAGIAASSPDVVVLDVRLPDGNGVEVCRDIRSDHPGVRVLMLTSFEDDQAMFDAIVAGADAYLLKDSRLDDLVAAIGKVAQGQSLLDPAVTERVFRRLRSDADEGRVLDKLTEQERRVLDLITDGRTNKQIAKHLYLAEQTVKNHVSSLLRKLGVESRTQAALYAAKLGKERPGSPLGTG